MRCGPEKKWFPRTFEAGWRYWAIVRPVKALPQIDMKRFIEDYAVRGLTTRVFNDAATALRWLESL
jgi:hypothetical protein